MRPLLAVAIFLSSLACHGEPPASPLPRPLPNGCMIHALLYIAGLDPAVGTAEVVTILGGGGIAHAIAVVTLPDGTRYGRDEDLGVFPLRGESAQKAFDQARREAIRRAGFRGRAGVVGGGEARRGLREALERLAAVGFEPEVVAGTVVWRIRGTAYVYSPRHGCVELRTRSWDPARIARAAARYWQAHS